MSNQAITVTGKSSIHKNTVGWVLSILFPAIILFIPLTELFTSSVRTTIAILMFCMINYGFELMENTVAAMMLPLLFITTGVASAAVALSGFTNGTVWGAFSGMVLVGCLSNTTILKKMSYGAMFKAGGNVKGICMAFGIVGIVLSTVLCSSIIIPFILIAYALVIALEIPLKSNVSASIMLSATFAAYSPMYYFMNPVTNLAINVAKTADPDLSISYTQYLHHNWPMMIFGLICVAIPFLILKADVAFSGREAIEKEYRTIPKLGNKEHKMMIVLIAAFLALVTNSIHKIDFNWVLLTAAVVCFIPALKLGDKKALDSVKWGSIVFMSCCLGIGAVFNAVGATDWLSSLILPLIANVGKVAGCFMIWLVGVLVNFLLTPMAAQSALLNPLVSIGAGIGISSEVVVYTFTMGVNQCLLPYEIVFFMLLFSCGAMSLKQFAKTTGAVMVASVIFLMVVMVPYWSFIGLL